VYRFALFLLLLGSVVALGQNPPQESSSQDAGAGPSALSAPPSQPIAPEVLDAEASIVKSDWKAAETRLDTWLADHPTDARALFDAGYVADTQNRLDDAAGLYRRATEANPKSLEAHLSLGLLLARQKNFDAARSELVTATRLEPGEGGPALKARAWRALAKIDEDSDPAAASNDLLQALKLSPETPDDTLLAANLADQSGQYDAAETAYRRVLAEDPKSAAANSGLAHVLIARKQYPEAENLLRAALEQNPDDPALTAQLAATLAAQNKAEALPLLQKLHKAQPDTPAITRMLAEVLAEAGDAAGSDELYAPLLAANPDNVDLLVAHARNLVSQAKYSEALKAFDKATAVDSADAEAWSGLAFVALKVNQPSVALHALTMRSKYLPEVPSTYFLWATAYDTLHDKEAAVTYYHHFLDSSQGKYPNQEWQAQQRLKLLENKK
jgi:predicted Zn-dependent protease